MTDQEIVQALIERDNAVTRQFFFVKCRPLIASIIRNIYSYPVDYDEMVSVLYEYLMENDAARLRQFQFRSSIYLWIKITAIRLFIARRGRVIDETSKEPPYRRPEESEVVDPAFDIDNKMDLQTMLELMPNRRYADVIQQVIINAVPPEQYALQQGITLANLYNLKKRAMQAFTRIALTYYSYGE